MSFLGFFGYFYHPRMWPGNAFGRMCLCVHLSVCLSVCNARPFETINLESSFLVYGYIFRIFGSVSCIMVIRSESRLQEQKSMKSYPTTPSVTNMAQSHCNCSDGKSISVIQRIMLTACSHTGFHRQACADFLPRCM